MSSTRAVLIMSHAVSAELSAGVVSITSLLCRPLRPENGSHQPTDDRGEHDVAHEMTSVQNTRQPASPTEQPPDRPCAGKNPRQHRGRAECYDCVTAWQSESTARERTLGVRPKQVLAGFTRTKTPNGDLENLAGQTAQRGREKQQVSAPFTPFADAVMHTQ